jgi:hypothetical protein
MDNLTLKIINNGPNFRAMITWLDENNIEWTTLSRHEIMKLTSQEMFGDDEQYGFYPFEKNNWYRFLQVEHDDDIYNNKSIAYFRFFNQNDALRVKMRWSNVS